MTKMISSVLLAVALFAVSPVAAEDTPPLSDNLKLLIKTALQAQDQQQTKAVIDTMLQAYPTLKTEILAYAVSIKADFTHPELAPAPAEIAPAETTPADTQPQTATPETILETTREPTPLFDPKLWNLQVELGAGNTTGDTKQTSLAFGLGMKRKFGEKWEHIFDADFNYAESEAIATQERYIAKYEVLWRPGTKLFLVNYVQAEQDKFSGFDLQVIENLGIGYQFANSDKLKFRVDGGPGVRYNNYEDNSIASETQLLGRIAADAQWKISDNFSISDKVAFTFAEGVTTMDNNFAVTSKFSDKLAARLSYQLKYDSAAPVGTEKWDTISRITLVYDF